MDTFVILSPGFPKDESDTSCLPAFQQFALSLKNLHPEINFTVIALQYPFEKKEYLWHGIKVISIAGQNKGGINKLFTLIKTYNYLKKIKRQSNILGILSLWLTECALIGKYFSQRNGIKHYSWLIGQDAKSNNKYIKRIKPKDEEVIAMSDFLSEELYKNHGIKPFMIAENGVNENAFPRFNTGERKIDILGVGSLIPLKNYNLFIEIIYELKKVFPEIKAVIIGSGDEEIELKKKAVALQLENNLSFTGSMPHSKVFDLMNQSTIFLHTSNYEGNSTVLMEALYSGCYTLSTQALSTRKTKHLFVMNEKSELIRLATERLLSKEMKAERVIFNTMNHTAQKIINLYLNKY